MTIEKTVPDQSVIKTQKLDGQISAEIIAQLGYLQFFHLSPTSQSVDIFINGVKVYKQIAYKQLTNKLTLPASSYHIDIYPTGIMVSSLFSRKIEIQPQTVHTIALSGEANDMKYTDTRMSIAATPHSQMKFIHAAADSPCLQPIFLKPFNQELPSITYKQTSESLSVFPGNYQGSLYGHPYRDCFASFQFTIHPKKHHLIYIFGSMTGNPPLEMMVLVQ